MNKKNKNIILILNLLFLFPVALFAAPRSVDEIDPSNLVSVNNAGKTVTCLRDGEDKIRLVKIKNDKIKAHKLNKKISKLKKNLKNSLASKSRKKLKKLKRKTNRMLALCKNTFTEKDAINDILENPIGDTEDTDQTDDPNDSIDSTNDPVDNTNTDPVDDPSIDQDQNEPDENDNPSSNFSYPDLTDLDSLPVNLDLNTVHFSPNGIGAGDPEAFNFRYIDTFQGSSIIRQNASGEIEIYLYQVISKSISTNGGYLNNPNVDITLVASVTLQNPTVQTSSNGLIDIDAMGSSSGFYQIYVGGLSANSSDPYSYVDGTLISEGDLVTNSGALLYRSNMFYGALSFLAFEPTNSDPNYFIEEPAFVTLSTGICDSNNNGFHNTSHLSNFYKVNRTSSNLDEVVDGLIQCVHTDGGTAVTYLE